VTIPKKHIPSLVSLDYGDNNLLIELMDIVKKVYQVSKHLHFHIVYGEPITGVD
jgi:histidine triad (HIT) family protein